MWTLIIIIALLIPLIAVILDSALVRALVARIEREGDGELPRVDHRLSALEGEVERLAREVERLGEEGAFLQRLLEARRLEGPEEPPEGPAGPPPSERRP